MYIFCSFFPFKNSVDVVEQLPTGAFNICLLQLAIKRESTIFFAVADLIFYIFHSGKITIFYKKKLRECPDYLKTNLPNRNRRHCSLLFFLLNQVYHIYVNAKAFSWSHCATLMNSLELHLFCLCVTDYKWGFFTFKLSIFFIPYHFVVFLFFSLLNTLTQQNHSSIIILSNLQHSAFNKISIGNISKSLTVKAFKKTLLFATLF